jgi:hypothetical protein
MNMPYFRDSREGSRFKLGQLERIASALERIARCLEQSCEDDAELAKTIPCDEDDVSVDRMRADPNTLGVDEVG